MSQDVSADANPPLPRTGDLFPGQNPPRKVDEELEHYVVKACEALGNHPDKLFCLKARMESVALDPFFASGDKTILFFCYLPMHFDVI